MKEFAGRVVVVTGAFGALGSVVAQTFATRGARVALLGRSTKASPPSLPSGESLVLSGVDLTNVQQVENAMAQVRGELGRLDVLVNVAGGFRWEKVEGGSVETWNLMYQMNLQSAVVATRAGLPHLLAAAPGSRIINIGAGAAARSAAAGMGAYTASKAGLLKFTESLADEVKSRGVTVNIVLPGTIDTASNRADMPDADTTAWVTPAAIAEVVAFLASDAAAAINGAAIPVGR